MEAEVLLYYQMPPEYPAVGALVDWLPICDRCAPVRVTGFCYRRIERRPLLWSVDPNGSRILIPSQRAAIRKRLNRRVLCVGMARRLPRSKRRARDGPACNRSCPSRRHPSARP